MTIAQRIMRCRLIEEAESDPEAARKLGIESPLVRQLQEEGGEHGNEEAGDKM